MKEKVEKYEWIDPNNFELKSCEKTGIADFFQTYFTTSGADDSGMYVGEVTSYLVEYLCVNQLMHLYTHTMSCDIETTYLSGNQPTSPFFTVNTSLKRPVHDYLNTILPHRGFIFMLSPKMSIVNTTRSLVRKSTIDELLADLA